MILLFVTVGSFGMFKPVFHRKHEVCLDCGAWRQSKQCLLVPGMNLWWGGGRTRFTDWYDARIGKPHDHRWVWSGCSALLNLWQMPVGYACGRGESLAHKGDWYGALLFRLEPLDIDLKIYRFIGHEDPDVRYETYWLMQSAPHDPQELPGWWEKARARLRGVEAEKAESSPDAPCW